LRDRPCETGEVSAAPPIVAVVGATASGKSDLALDLAGRLGGEIVNTDAMAVYRGMDVGTAKLPASERRGIPHHLLDYLGVSEPLTVAQFQRDARSVIAGLRARGRVPVLVGGSALYTRAVLDRFEFPGTDESVRRRLEAELAQVGAPAMHRRLAEVDPVAAGRILVDNARRIVRALEVVEITQRPFSATLPRLEYADPQSVQVGVDIDRPTLDQRIEGRVEAMFAGGFVEEVERLLDQGLREGRTAATAIGYREVAAYLDGELSLDEARERTLVATRRFARRQDSWFRKDPRIVWVRYDDPERAEKALDAVGRFMRA
jgi:tRNA dimethylallyltransferase